MKVNWTKCNEDKWCGFETVDLDSAHFDNLRGVYVVWFVGEAPNVVRIGQGNIAERLTDHRENKEITKHNSNGKMLATWASVPEANLDGVEAYLANRLTPLVGERFPDVHPIEINLPGQE